MGVPAGSENTAFAGAGASAGTDSGQSQQVILSGVGASDDIPGSPCI